MAWLAVVEKADLMVAKTAVWRVVHWVGGWEFSKAEQLDT